MKNNSDNAPMPESCLASVSDSLLTPIDLIEFAKWVNKMGYSHRLKIIPNDLIDYYLKNKENIIKLNKEDYH